MLEEGQVQWAKMEKVVCSVTEIAEDKKKNRNKWFDEECKLAMGKKNTTVFKM